jgi:hypothetical protein
MTVPGCDGDLLSGPRASEAARALGVRGFIALWRGERQAITELTTDVPMARALSAAGRLELDDHDILVGVHGLTARTTTHRIEHAGGTVHTWCALDAIGIPAALGLDAAAVTACAWCGVELRVVLWAGDPSADPDVRLWLPTGPCSHLVEDFCRHTNLYCNPAHRASVVPPDQPGQAIDVAEAAAIGRTTWRDVAAISQDLIGERP